MEGPAEDFEFFKHFNFDDMEELYKVFPFYESIETENQLYDAYLPNMSFYQPGDDHKNITDEKELLDKLSKFEKSYNNIIQKDIIASPTINSIEKIKTFESNLKLAEGTLPGLIIAVMHREKSPVDEPTLLTAILPKYEGLRKTNGAKYNGELGKVLSSTLRSSGLFIKTLDNKYYFKEKEAVDYILKITEKVLTRKLERESKDVKPVYIVKSKTSKKKKKSELSFSAQMNYKINKVYNILDQMLSQCRGKLELAKMNNAYKETNSSIELLQKIGDQNKIVGILMCFKFFKSIIHKYLKISQKKKNLEGLIDLNKINDKLDLISSKIQLLEKNLDKFSENANMNTYSSSNSNVNTFNKSFFSNANNILFSDNNLKNGFL